jgi:hypothetical protein
VEIRQHHFCDTRRCVVQCGGLTKRQ